MFIKNFVNAFVAIFIGVSLMVIIIGLLMKVANYVGESIGIYKFLQNLWKRVKKIIAN